MDSQVARMLVGGMKVIGIYIWVSDTVFKNSTITLCQVNSFVLPYSILMCVLFYLVYVVTSCSR